VAENFLFDRRVFSSNLIPIPAMFWSSTAPLGGVSPNYSEMKREKMTDTSDAEFQAISERMDEAWTADVPSLVEIRECREKMVEHIALCVIEVMKDDRDEPASKPALRVISNNSPDTSSLRGICSPVKTEKLRSFEDTAISVFGNIESCTTAWVTEE
jgi:hypothetical protein